MSITLKDLLAMQYQLQVFLPISKTLIKLTTQIVACGKNSNYNILCLEFCSTNTRYSIHFQFTCRNEILKNDLRRGQYNELIFDNLVIPTYCEVFKLYNGREILLLDINLSGGQPCTTQLSLVLGIFQRNMYKQLPQCLQ